MLGQDDRSAFVSNNGGCHGGGGPIEAKVAV